MKRYCSVIFAAMLVFSLAACGMSEEKQATTTQVMKLTTTTTQPPTTAKEPEASFLVEYEFVSNINISYLSTGDLVVNGVSLTNKNFPRKFDPPLNIEIDEYGNKEYDYGAFRYFEDSDGSGAVHIIGKTVLTPRNIQVGDSFQEVMNKFPQERDFRTTPDGNFYGVMELRGDFYYDCGRVNEGGDPQYGGEGLTISIFSESDPWIKVHFEGGLVSSIMVYLTRF